ncbi:MAG: hypothetical protein E7365_06195 [Clostridiales bacterium]|nr:hypothetical protein [Clostridiales bacterium]
MKKVLRIIGIILIALQVLSLFGAGASITEYFSAGLFGLMFLFGYFLPGIIGVLLIIFSRNKK